MDTQTQSLQTALVEFKHQEITHEDLAKHVGFSDREMNMLKIFWEPAFNKSWFYLYPEFITGELGYKNVNKFYGDVLRKKYIENIDYQKIDKDDDLVKKFAGEISPAKKRRAYNESFYKITGKTLKLILMRARTKVALETHEYYIKIEELCILMKDYVQELSMYKLNASMEKLQIQSKEAIEEKEKLLLQAQEEIKEKDKELELRTIHKAIFDKAMKITNKDQEVYIITKKAYTADFKFKIGISTTSSHKRLTSLNTGNIKEDEAYICHIEKCYDAALVEKVIHKQLHKFNHDKEWFQFPYDLVQKIVIYACNNLNDYNEYYNDIMDEYNQQLLNNTIKIITPKPLAPNYRCRIVLENGPDKIVLKDLRELTEDEKNRYIAKILLQYDVNVDVDDNVPHKPVKWIEYQLTLKNELVKDNYKVNTNTFKSRKWKTILKNLYGQYITLLG